jgi:hypothetical protein
MALDAYGVALALSSVCPLDGTAGPYQSSGVGIYPDGANAFWRLDFGANATAAQQQSAITTLAGLSSYTPPATPTPLTPYKLTGSVTFGATLALGTPIMFVPVPGLLRTDAPMIAYGTALPNGVDPRSEYPDPTRDGYLAIQVAVLSLLSGSTPVPFTLIGVR